MMSLFNDAMLFIHQSVIFNKGPFQIKMQNYEQGNLKQKYILDEFSGMINESRLLTKLNSGCP